MARPPSEHFTTFGWIACFWVLLSSLQYGFNISVLNQLQAVMSCQSTNGTVDYAYGLPTCIPMSDTVFSVITAAFTLGGVFGSLGANILMEKQGRKGALRTNTGLICLGALLITCAASELPLLLGRILVGIGSGIGSCVVPVFIGEIAPYKMKGSVGVLTQVSIVSGILLTQTMGLLLASPKLWRAVPLFSAALSAVQFFVSAIAVESPAWLEENDRSSEAGKVCDKLWKKTQKAAESGTPADDDEEPLLEDDDRASHNSGSRQPTVNVWQLLKAKELRKPLLIVSIMMTTQQSSGINAILYYSNNILSNTLPELAAYVSLGITFINFIMTFPSIYLIEAIGRRKLLFISVVGAVTSHVLVGYGLNAGFKILSSVAIIAFVASFSCGLGPVPFVIISDVSPLHAVSAISAVALAINWFVNFLVGLVFLPLRNTLSGGNPDREGRVFNLFAAILAVFSLLLSRVYRV